MKKALPEPWHYAGGMVPHHPSVMLEHGMTGFALCLGCGRKAALDLQALVDRGLGEREIERLRPVCSGCGSRSCQVGVEQRGR